jgi:hypothetical protein
MYKTIGKGERVKELSDIIKDHLASNVSELNAKKFNTAFLLTLLKNGIISVKKFAELCGGEIFIKSLYDSGYITEEMMVALLELASASGIVKPEEGVNPEPISKGFTSTSGDTCACKDDGACGDSYEKLHFMLNCIGSARDNIRVLVDLSKSELVDIEIVKKAILTNISVINKVESLIF